MLSKSYILLLQMLVLFIMLSCGLVSCKDSKNLSDNASVGSVEDDDNEAGSVADHAFTKTVDQIIQENPDKWNNVYLSDDARSVVLRFHEGSTAFQGLDDEVLPFVEYLETTRWLEGFHRESDTLWDGARAGMMAVGAIGHAAYAPGSSLSPEMVERCLDAIEAIGEFESSEIRASCIAATRALLGERPDFIVADDHYQEAIERWSQTPKAPELAEKILFELIPKRFE